MKDKKTWIIVGCLVLVVLVVAIILFNKKDSETDDKKDDKDVTSLVLEAAKNSNKNASDYKKFLGGEVLSESTYFNEYTFISNNKAYVFDPQKLENGEFSYRKVLDIPEDLKIVNIGIPVGADICFITSDDAYYRI